MDSKLFYNKINLCLIGSGAWGSKVLSVAKVFDRFNEIFIINSSTSEDEKNQILEKSDIIYIATPSNTQYEYVKYCIENDKFAICESPFLKNSEERKEIFDLLQSRKPRFFYVNNAYYMDSDFSRLVMHSFKNKSKFITIKCSGDRFKEDLIGAKKFYSNQCIFLIIAILNSRHVKKIDKFIINNNYSGQIISQNVAINFEWEYSDSASFTIKSHGEDDTFEASLLYDKYDHILPLLKLVTDQYFLIYPQALMFQSNERNKEIFQSTMIESFLIQSTCEYFSDLFSQTNEADPVIVDDPLKLFFNGSFSNN